MDNKLEKLLKIIILRKYPIFIDVKVELRNWQKPFEVGDYYFVTLEFKEEDYQTVKNNKDVLNEVDKTIRNLARYIEVNIDSVYFMNNQHHYFQFF
jgi:hypothetical protein